MHLGEPIRRIEEMPEPVIPEPEPMTEPAPERESEPEPEKEPEKVPVGPDGEPIEEDE